MKKKIIFITFLPLFFLFKIDKINAEKEDISFNKLQTAYEKLVKVKTYQMSLRIDIRAKESAEKTNIECVIKVKNPDFCYIKTKGDLSVQYYHKGNKTVILHPNYDDWEYVDKDELKEEPFSVEMATPEHIYKILKKIIDNKSKMQFKDTSNGIKIIPTVELIKNIISVPSGIILKNTKVEIDISFNADGFFKSIYIKANYFTNVPIYEPPDEEADVDIQRFFKEGEEELQEVLTTLKFSFAGYDMELNLNIPPKAKDLLDL